MGIIISRWIFLTPITSIIKAQGAERTHEKNNLLTWIFRVGYKVLVHKEIMDHDGDVSVPTSAVFPEYRCFSQYSGLQKRLFYCKSSNMNHNFDE